MQLQPHLRDLRSKKEVLEALNANKDFMYIDIFSPWNGKPINWSQVKELGHKLFEVRYKRTPVGSLTPGYVNVMMVKEGKDGRAVEA